MLSGFINLYKESNMTSNKALSILKRKLKENNIDTKVGHFGTLDPIAEGVLPVALGRATRLFDYFLDKSKTYVATFLFGTETDTLDVEGAILSKDDVDILESDVLGAIGNFVGEISQMPPQYSAKSVDGVRAYKLARQGIAVDLQPKNVTIHSLVFNKKVSKNTYEFTITCSSGTYIRSLARDLGIALGTVCVMAKLIRTSSGFFRVENALKLDELTNIEQNIYPIETFSDKFEKIILTSKQKTDLVNGIFPQINNLKDGYYAVYDDKILMGIGERLESGRLRLKTWLL